MPANWSMVDNSFPTFTGEEKPREQVRELVNYMRILVEELKYQLANLDATNWNATAMKNFQVDTTAGVSKQTQELVRELTTLEERLEKGATFEAEVQFDSDGVWRSVRRLLGEDPKRSYVLPIIPRRCDHYRVRLRGTGGCMIYSMTRVYYVGSEFRSRGWRN